MGNIIVGDWASYIFTYEGSNTALVGFMNAITIILSTPFLIGAIVAILVNLILPDEYTAPSDQEEDVEALPTLAAQSSQDGDPSKDEKIDSIVPV